MEKRATSLLMAVGLSLCFALASPHYGQSSTGMGYAAARSHYENGRFAEAIEIAFRTIGNVSVQQKSPHSFPLLEIAASSQMSLEKFDAADETIKRAALLASTPREKARVQCLASLLSRLRRNYPQALQQAKNALGLAPNDHLIEAEYYYLLGRIFFGQGFDASAIVWLEKAVHILVRERDNPLLFDSYRFLSLAWAAKFNYQQALEYAEKWVDAASKSRHKYKHRQALYNLAELFSTTGQKRKSLETAELGLKLALLENNAFQGSTFSELLLLKALAEGDLSRSREYLKQLENIDRAQRFAFERLLAKGVIAAYEGDEKKAERFFSELQRMSNSSEFLLPTWRIAVAKRSKDWKRVLDLNRELFELNEKFNYRDDLPGIYLDSATAYYYLGQPEKALDQLEKSLAHIEEIRQSENTSLSLGLSDVFHKAYRLLAQLSLDEPQKALDLTDFLKSRLLKDKINGSVRRSRADLPLSVRQTIERLSIAVIDDPSLASELERAEQLVTRTVPKLDLERTGLSELDRIPALNDTAVVSFFFTLGHRLIAHVGEKSQRLRTVYLPASEPDLGADVIRMEQKIKNRVFFKRDGKELYDKLLKPLNISATHIIIIPDKQLWKIPFQALSPDGERYLIEDKLVSYAPSVAVLIEQLKSPKPARMTLQAFANSSYNNRILRYVNDESTSVSTMFNSRPVLNATTPDFRRLSDKSDMLHFSMHAQVDNDQPLDSFLGFRPVGKDNGRLTVEDILDSKLKKGSLVFLASCDTNNVLSGEGLVSLAWGMMGAGASTVISAQWDANDNSTKIFTDHFYKSYKGGMSSAEAIQKASVELIKNKASKLHEPYFWAAFAISGDFR